MFNNGTLTICFIVLYISFKTFHYTIHNMDFTWIGMMSWFSSIEICRFMDRLAFLEEVVLVDFRAFLVLESPSTGTCHEKRQYYLFIFEIRKVKTHRKSLHPNLPVIGHQYQVLLYIGTFLK